MCGRIENGSFLTEKDAVARIQFHHQRGVLARDFDGKTVVGRKIEVAARHAVEDKTRVESVRPFQKRRFKLAGASVIAPGGDGKKADADSVRRRLAVPFGCEDGDAVAAPGRALRHAEHVALESSEGKIPEQGKCKIHDFSQCCSFDNIRREGRKVKRRRGGTDKNLCFFCFRTVKIQKTMYFKGENFPERLSP